MACPHTRVSSYLLKVDGVPNSSTHADISGKKCIADGSVDIWKHDVNLYEPHNHSAVALCPDA